jgi:hypothetical protein
MQSGVPAVLRGQLDQGHLRFSYLCDIPLLPLENKDLLVGNIFLDNAMVHSD